MIISGKKVKFEMRIHPFYLYKYRDALVINSESLGLYDIPPTQHISCEFSRLLNNPELSDFVIVPAGGQEFHVHQVILITRWPHFRNIYKSGMMESREKRMEIPEPYEVVLAFLKYLYNDRLDKEESCEVICEVLVLANMYLLERLKKICCERLYREHLNMSSCGYIFEKAMMAEEHGLKMLTLDYMFQHYGQVLKQNIVMEMPLHVRKAFLEAVPNDAVLNVSQHASSLNRVQHLKANASPFLATRKMHSSSSSSYVTNMSSSSSSSSTTVV